MRRILGVGVVLLVGSLLLPSDAAAQQTGSGRPQKAQLGGNYPNPFNPETTIPFELFEEMFRGGKPVVVTLEIRDLLGRLVAIPDALNQAGGVKLKQLQYTAPGRYAAHWDGRDVTGREVASGTYFSVLIVNGERLGTRIMTVAK